MVVFLFAAFVVLILLGLDVAFSMVLASYLGILIKTTRQVDATIVPLRMIAGVDIFSLVAIPLFILAGDLMNKSGITRRLIDFSLSLVGHLKGSLSQVAVITNLIMAGVSGSGVADASATGSILIPAMNQEGYEPEYSGAVIAAAATIGPIIPPSIPMVIYGVMGNVSIGKLFMAGFMPGLFLGGGFMLMCWFLAVRRNYPAHRRATLQQCVRTFRHAIWALIMPVIILGGIVFGFVTVTEAATTAVVYALLVGLFIHREIRLKDLPEIIFRSGVTSGVVMILLAAAGIFSWLLAESQVNTILSQFLLSLSKNPLVLLLLINLLLLIVGCLLEPLPALIIFVPALIPIGNNLGIDPIHFGAVIVLNLMIGMLTPPVGFLLFVVSAVGKIPMGPLIREVMPFLLMALIVLAIATFFPAFTTWLPGIVK
jgi:tripartite ATP-independent transporter DctM subunit